MKNKLFSLIVFLFVCLPLFSQNNSMPKVGEDGVYLVPDKMPEFPGGMQAMMNYLSSSIRYPRVAQENGTSGRVMVQFVVMEDGTLNRVKVIRKVDPLLDAEAVRVIKAMPVWTPGMADGKVVKVQFTVPIMFSLGEKAGAPRSAITFPKGQEVKNKKLPGIWQLCMVGEDAQSYRLSLAPCLKVFSKDKTFMNIIFEADKRGSLITVQGKYKLSSDGYVEKMDQSLFTQFPAGVKNKIQVEFLHDNLIKLTFEVPGREKPGMEYWYRIPSPDLLMKAN